MCALAGDEGPQLRRRSDLTVAVWRNCALIPSSAESIRQDLIAKGGAKTPVGQKMIGEMERTEEHSDSPCVAADLRDLDCVAGNSEACETARNGDPACVAWLNDNDTQQRLRCIDRAVHDQACMAKQPASDDDSDQNGYSGAANYFSDAPAQAEDCRRIESACLHTFDECANAKDALDAFLNRKIDDAAATRAMSNKSPLASPGPAKRLQFKLRGDEMNRIEAVSDVVFGFALTLLVVSLQVPRTYADLIGTMHGFPAFALAFAALMVVWARHYYFFRYYGLDDPATIVLNTLLLFVVLFYVYPLKFLCHVWLAPLTGMAMRITDAQGVTRLVMAYGDTRGLMLIFGSGFTAVYLAFAALYRHAWRMREVLHLSAFEIAHTRTSVVVEILTAGRSARDGGRMSAQARAGRQRGLRLFPGADSRVVAMAATMRTSVNYRCRSNVCPCILAKF